MREPYIRYRWNGEGHVPLKRYVARAQARFDEGEVNALLPAYERSKESHDHFFVLGDLAYENLPEIYEGRWANAEHLRKWCLIKAGFRKEFTWVANSPEHAFSAIPFIQQLDEYAVVMADENIVTVYTAKTQKMRKSGQDGMGKEEFQASKDAVMREWSKLLGVDVATLQKQEVASPPVQADDTPPQEREAERT
jgi:hypothetical protein